MWYLESRTGKNMLKGVAVATCFVISLMSFSFEAFAQTDAHVKKYYAAAIYESNAATGANGEKLSMNVVSKTFDKKTCWTLAAANPKMLGNWALAGADCVEGEEFDKSFETVFNDEPALSVYLSFVNSSGFETRINFVTTAGNNSKIPDYPMPIPAKIIMPAIANMKQSIQATGIKHIKIIHPAKAVSSGKK
jgi:hypothetical protein